MVLLIINLTPNNNNTVFILDWLAMVYKELITSKSNVENKMKVKLPRLDTK